MHRGLVDMLGATLAFTVMIGLVKLVSDTVHPIEVVFWRGLIGFAVMMALPGPRRLRTGRPVLLTLRVMLGTATMMCFFVAAQGLTVAQVSLISKVQPLLIAVAAPLLLGQAERVDKRVAYALATGLTGCVVLLLPDVGTPALRWSLWALAAAGLSTGAHLCVRLLGRTEDPRTVVTWFQLGAAVLAATGWGLATGRLPTLPGGIDAVYVLGVGAAATTGQWLMTRAYQRAPAPAVASMSYTGPAWAVLGDVLVFGAWPDAWSWAGGVLVVAAGLGLVAGARSDARAAAAPRAATPQSSSS